MRRPLLGPCKCQGCGRFVTWDGVEWIEAGERYGCSRDLAIAICHTCNGIIDARGTEVPTAVRVHNRSPRHRAAYEGLTLVRAA
jgi:E3 ubiquitin-protein ligase DOA10